MKIAIFSDVHGNLTALQVILDKIQRQANLDSIIFAGDLCLFGPRPAECVALIQQQKIQCLGGNTDLWLRNPPSLLDDISSEERKRRSIIRDISDWTREQFSQAEWDWLQRIIDKFQIRISPDSSQDNDLLIVHANPVDLLQLIFPPENIQYEMYGEIRQSDAEALRLLGDVKNGTIAFGHLHIPFTRRIMGINLFNISSVSMPGDGDPRAKYAILSWDESSGWEVEHKYVHYDIKPEITAFESTRPPGWEVNVRMLEADGMIQQRV